jgi:hypothetical protein
MYIQKTRDFYVYRTSCWRSSNHALSRGDPVFLHSALVDQATFAPSVKHRLVEKYWFSSELFDVTVHKHVQCFITLNTLETLQFVIVYTVSSPMLWNVIWLVQPASAETNEMRYREFNKNQLDPPRVNTEKRHGSRPLACEDVTTYMYMYS